MNDDFYQLHGEKKIRDEVPFAVLMYVVLYHTERRLSHIEHYRYLPGLAKDEDDVVAYAIGTLGEGNKRQTILEWFQKVKTGETAYYVGYCRPARALFWQEIAQN